MLKKKLREHRDRHERRKAATHQRLIDAARDLISAKGYSQVDILDITERADAFVSSTYSGQPAAWSRVVGRSSAISTIHPGPLPVIQTGMHDRDRDVLALEREGRPQMPTLVAQPTFEQAQRDIAAERRAPGP